MRKSLFVVLAASGLFATQAIAQDYGNVYVGFGVGKTNLETTVSPDVPGYEAGTFKTDGDASTAYVFLGYSFNPYLAVEGGITSTTSADGEASIEGGNLSTSTDMRAFEVVAKGTIPLGKFELFGRAGAIYGDNDYDLKLAIQDRDDPSFYNPNRASASYQDTGLIIGLGAGFNFGRGSLRIQYDYTTLENGGTDSYILTGSDSGGTNFTQKAVPLTIQTKNPTRLMLTVSAYF